MSESGVDLGPILAGLDRLGPPGRGRRLGVLEAEADQGAAGLARDLVRAGIADAQPTLLVDAALDAICDHAAWFSVHGADQSCSLGPARDGRLRTASFVRGMAGAAGSPLALRQIGSSRAYLIHPRPEALAGVRRFTPDVSEAFWAAASNIAALTIMTAPPICEASDGLAFARHLDGVVLVVSAQTGSVRAAVHAARQLTAARAALLGIVYTEADPGLVRLELRWPVWAA